jgi:5-methylcytosine-specific restriction endonuclease McrA
MRDLMRAYKIAPVCKAAAKRLGVSHFFTGRPCQRGHVANRYASGGKCVECAREDHAKRMACRPPKQPRTHDPERAKLIDRAIRSARRARQKAAEGRFTAADIRALETRQRGKCACCGKKRNLAVDHIVPLAKGGTNWPNNLQLLCTSCNCAKGAKDPITFMQEKGLLL